MTLDDAVAIFMLAIAAGFGICSVALFSKKDEFTSEKSRRFLEFVGGFACAIVALYCLAIFVRMGDVYFYNF